MPTAPRQYNRDVEGARKLQPEPNDNFKRRNDTDAEKSFYTSAKWRRTRAAYKAHQRRQDLKRALKIHQQSSTSTLQQLERWKESGECLCEHCLDEGMIMPGNVCDHITRIRDGGDRFAWDNLQFLCHHHHNIKSGKEAHQ